MSAIKRVTHIMPIKLGDSVVLDDRVPFNPGGANAPDHVIENVVPGIYDYYRVDIEGTLPVYCMVRWDAKDGIPFWLSNDALIQYFEHLFDEAEFPPNPVDATLQGHEWVGESKSENSLIHYATYGGASESPEDGEHVYVRLEDGKISAFMLDRADIIGTMQYKGAEATPLAANRQLNWNMAVSGEPFECFSGVGGLDDEDWDMADGWDDLELGQGPRTEIHYLFGASPETVEHFTSERLERLDYGGGTKELFVTVGFDNGQQHVYLAPYSAGMKGYREMLQIASEQVEEYLRQKDLDISDLDVETDKQL